jgi:streptogramin lyase
LGEKLPSQGKLAARIALDFGGMVQEITETLLMDLPFSDCEPRDKDQVWRSRRHFLKTSLGCGLLAISGCQSDTGGASDVEAIWGKRGLSNGKFHKPRAMTVDAQGNTYVVDMTARIQVFDPEGRYLRQWQTPICEQGRPTGLSVDRLGRVMVADTHYFRVLFYSPDGELDPSATIGGTHGTGPGEFGFVTDIVEDKEGNFFVSEYGVSDRIQKFTADGQFVCQWGGHGGEPGQFERPQSLGIDSSGQIWVCDACNHRLQVFRCTGENVELIRVIGRQGNAAGEFQYPYGMVIDPDDRIWVSEFGGHRIQRLDPSGNSQLVWGKAGRNPGELANPWAIAQHKDGGLLIVDSGNHRIQKVRL